MGGVNPFFIINFAHVKKYHYKFNVTMNKKAALLTMRLLIVIYR